MVFRLPVSASLQSFELFYLVFLPGFLQFFPNSLAVLLLGARHFIVHEIVPDQQAGLFGPGRLAATCKHLCEEQAGIPAGHHVIGIVPVEQVGESGYDKGSDVTGVDDFEGGICVGVFPGQRCFCAGFAPF